MQTVSMGKFVDRIRERMMMLAINESQLAKLCGTSQPTVNRLLKGEVENPSYILELATALRTTVPWLRTGIDDLKYETQGSMPAGGFSGAQYKGSFNNTLVPVYGMAAGENDGKVIFNEDFIVEWVETPTELKGVRGAWRFYVHGDSMEPRYYHGELASVHPYKPLQIGKDCAVVLEDYSTIIKRYMGETKSEVHLMQYNPRKEFSLKKVDIRLIYAIVR